jgi:hypothetical protein
MKKAKFNLLIDILNFLAFLITSVSGLVLYFVLSISGFKGGRAAVFKNSFLGIERGLWKSAHVYVGIAMIVIVVIHLILHWNYIKNIKKLLRG